jgi:hypothetical protein
MPVNQMVSTEIKRSRRLKLRSFRLIVIHLGKLASTCFLSFEAEEFDLSVEQSRLNRVRATHADPVKFGNFHRFPNGRETRFMPCGIDGSHASGFTTTKPSGRSNSCSSNRKCPTTPF